MASSCTFGIPWPDWNAGVRYCDTISVRDQSKTLLGFYCLRHKHSASAEGWLQRISNAQIRVDGELILDPELILRVGAKLEYHRLPWKEPPAPHLLQVLYEDNHLVALNKPAGLQVLPGGLFQQRTVLTQLQWRDRDAIASTSTATEPTTRNELWATSPVHRLGRGTSGVLLCAKSPEAKSRLAADLAEATESTTTASAGVRGPTKQNQLRDRRLLKTYRALASGLIEPEEVTVDHPIGRELYPGVAGGLYMASSRGKPSVSKVFVLRRRKEENCTVVQVEILTGRPHQIRIHLASLGHPLVGDPLYLPGGRPLDSFGKEHNGNSLSGASPADDGGYSKPRSALPGDVGYMLHAWRLEFYHPISKEKMLVIAPPPPSLRAPNDKGA